MNIIWTPQFKRMWKKANLEKTVKATKVIKQLTSDRIHPSLRLKRIRKDSRYWEVRIDRSWRIICRLSHDTVKLIAIGSHDILDRFKRN